MSEAAVHSVFSAPPGEHARIAPSSLARTVQCPGSIQMQERYPEPEGPEAKEGTAAHWGYAELMAGRLIAEGQIAANGVTLDEEMIESAELMAETVTRWGVPAAVEQRVAIPSVHPTDCWGTPDASAWAVPRSRLKIADLKHGHGFVDAYEFWQGLAYAWGHLDAARIDGREEHSCVIELTVVQPRNYHRDGPVRTWTLTAADSRGYRNIATAAAHEALGQNPKTKAGPECKHCTARHACPTLGEAGLDVVDQAGKAVPLDLSTLQASRELRRLDYGIGQAMARRDGLEAQLLAAARSGQAVPYYHVEHGLGREYWVKPSAEVFALGDIMGQDLRRHVPITPTQARKRGIDVPGYSRRDVGAGKLVLDSPHKAAKIFGGQS